MCDVEVGYLMKEFEKGGACTLQQGWKMETGPSESLNNIGTLVLSICACSV